MSTSSCGFNRCSSKQKHYGENTFDVIREDNVVQSHMSLSLPGSCWSTGQLRKGPRCRWRCRWWVCLWGSWLCRTPGPSHQERSTQQTSAAEILLRTWTRITRGTHEDFRLLRSKVPLHAGVSICVEGDLDDPFRYRLHCLYQISVMSSNRRAAKAWCLVDRRQQSIVTTHMTFIVRFTQRRSSN